jgi:protocatechuate 3,4-dioxygenase beta subunit
MFFEGDPLLPYDVIWNSVPDALARARLVAGLDWATSEDHHALGYRFDLCLRGRKSTPWET